jgi:hypothetical protein
MIILVSSKYLPLIAHSPYYFNRITLKGFAVAKASGQTLEAFFAWRKFSGGGNYAVLFRFIQG